MSMVAHHSIHLNSHLEVYIVRHTHRAGKKNTISVSTNSNVSFCGTYGCSNLSLSSHCGVLGKWMSGTHVFTWTTGPQNKLHRFPCNHVIWNGDMTESICACHPCKWPCNSAAIESRKFLHFSSVQNPQAASQFFSPPLHLSRTSTRKICNQVKGRGVSQSFLSLLLCAACCPVLHHL